MSRMLRIASAACAALLFLPLAACLGGDGPDGGPCGFVGGPNDGDSLGSYQVGADPTATPTVEIVRYRDGECAGDGGYPFWLQLDGDTIRVDARADGATLDLSAATLGSTGGDGSTYTFASGTSVRVTRVGEDIDVSFSDGAGSAQVRCSLSGTDAIACQ